MVEVSPRLLSAGGPFAFCDEFFTAAPPLPKFRPVLARLGATWDIPHELKQDLEEFTYATYSRSRFKNVDT